MPKTYCFPIQLLVIFLSITPHSHAANTLCEEGRIKSFIVSQFGGPLQGAKVGEYCKVSTSKLPVKVKTALKSLVKTNKQVAKLFGLSVKELLPKKVSVSITSSKGGPIASSYSSKSIDLGTFAEWPGGAIDEAVYAHELGHYLSDSINSKLGGFHRLTLAPLLIEAAADDIAFSLFKTLFRLKSQLPSCLSELRHIDAQSTFSLPIGDFDRDASARNLNECCNSLKGSKKQTIYGQRLCGHIQKTLAQVPLPPYNSLPFDPTLTTDLISIGYDPHRLGIPLISFLAELKEGYGIQTSALVNFLKTADDSQFITSYSCTLPALPGVVTKTTSYRTGDVLEALRSQFIPIDGGALFDQKWQQHRIDIGVDFADNLTEASAKLQVEREYSSHLDFENLTDEQHTCLNEFDSFDDPSRSEFCQVSCTK